jgi:cytochrome c oxidase subunit 2
MPALALNLYSAQRQLASAVVPVLSPVSPDATAIRNLFIWVFVICLAIFLIVVGLIVISLYLFRASGSVPPAQRFGSHRAEIGWIVPPTVIVLVLGLISARVIFADNAIPARDAAGLKNVDVIVVGHQWWWEIRYPDSGAVAANEIHIPVGRKLRVQVDAADVIHSFWVPQLGPKKDMIPGQHNFVWLQADRAGTYEGACAEFCGNQHAWMRFTVVAEDERQYQAWLAHQTQPALPPASPPAAAGMSIVLAQTCASCHAIAGTSAVANAAPDLTHFAGRSSLAAGIVPNTPQNLARWLKDPQLIKPGCKMPNFSLTGAQIDQLVAYLEGLQ